MRWLNLGSSYKGYYDRFAFYSSGFESPWLHENKIIIMDKEKVIEAITEWFNANYEINIDYSTMIINIKESSN